MKLAGKRDDADNKMEGILSEHQMGQVAPGGCGSLADLSSS